MKVSLPEGGSFDAAIGHGEEGVQGVKVLDEGLKVMTQSKQHLVVAVHHAVGEKVLAKQFQHCGHWHSYTCM